MIDKNLLGLLGDKKKYIYISVLLMLTGLVSSIAITWCICRSISLMLGHAVIAEYRVLALIAFIALSVRYISTRLTGSVKDELGREVKRDLRDRIYEKIVVLGMRTKEQISMAALTQISMEGVEQLDLYYSLYIPQFFYAVLAPFVLFAVTVGIEWRVAVLLILCVPLIPLSIMAVSGYAKRIFGKYWDKYTNMGDGFLDSVQGLRELKIYRADGDRHEKMNENAEEFRRITMKVLVMQLASTTLMDLIAYGGAALGIALTVSSVSGRALDPVQGLFLVLVAVEFFLPLRAFGSAFHIAMNGAGAGRKILDLLEAPAPVWGGRPMPGCGLSLADVHFSYDGRRDVLAGISIDFPEKGMTAIAGESGCGKSTIVNLLTGVYTPDSGRVFVRAGSEASGCAGTGTDICDLDRAAFYRELGVVSVNSYIFHMSVRDNFRMAKSDISDEEIYAALDRVNLAGFIRENGGPDKIIMEDAGNLSGGQKQRLALAIAMVADKSIYIFDEATSNIDIESESIIMDNISMMAKSKSVIVISHRLANIERADRIYYLEAGAVAEQGSHSELLACGGKYAKLYNLQKHLECGYMDA